MDDRIAKASKVPFLIRFVRLGRVAVRGLFGCFIRLTEGHRNEGDAPVRKPLIATGLNTILVFVHMLAYTWSTLVERMEAFQDP